MKIKTIVISVCFILTLLFTGIEANDANAKVVRSTHEVTKKATVDFVYVRLFINGHWWMYVYDGNGTLILIYLDEDE